MLMHFGSLDSFVKAILKTIEEYRQAKGMKGSPSIPQTGAPNPDQDETEPVMRMPIPEAAPEPAMEEKVGGSIHVGSSQG